DPQGARRGRHRGRQRVLPDRFGEPATRRGVGNGIPSGSSEPPARKHAVIGRVIQWCATHRGLVLVLTTVAFLGSLLVLGRLPLDAIPDLSDPQVIVFTEWMGRSPDLVEDQVTYPIVSSLLGAPNVEAVRGQSMFGMSFIYVIFKEGTNLYWARS